MFQKVDDPAFVAGEHEVLRFWRDADVFRKLQRQNAGKPKWSFLDGPITANNPMGVHHAWGRTYKDAYQRYFAMTGRELRYQNGFDCQGLWVEVEVEKELKLGTKTGIVDYGIDRFVWECKKRVLKFAARQTEQSVRLGYWMEWDDPDELRKLAAAIGEQSTSFSRDPKGSAATDNAPTHTYVTARGQTVTEPAEQIVAKLGNPEWGGSYFTFSTENNETIWTFLKKCFERKKIYMGHDVMPWSGRAGSAYSQMEVADGRKLTTHRSCFVRFPLWRDESGERRGVSPPVPSAHRGLTPPGSPAESNEFLLVWTTTPWTLTSNVACAVNPDLEYVRLRAKKDGAVYYFAKDNLESKRLEKEFKEGFGRPEWTWPDGVGKLKSIAQLFKEQGGYEIEGTLKGAEMVGWRYAGPFDDLDAQQKAQGLQPLGLSAHVVIDGGRDSKGNAIVVAGEGTGIVHIAPGCGDVDHVIGKQLGLPIIAPLQEDGTFGEGFGPFTGREAIDPKTADLVFEELKKKGLLVYVETYPHIYPHCWRTGDELVFRLVDEWFINMDWREEIKDVTREIEWLPPEVEGRERELEWLSNMRDWMISKKRFWGLALPIWVNPEDPSDFEVIGSLAELKERALELDRGAESHGSPTRKRGTESRKRSPLADAAGYKEEDGTRSVPATQSVAATLSGWDQFEGHTPHRPWIDAVKIRSRKTGAVLSRIVDVGNPWLDAGIVPFSTLNYGEWKRGQGPRAKGQGTGEGREPRGKSQGPTSSALPLALDSGHLALHWPDWYPPDFVVECFPGQFRNWFYSLLALSTMMRYDETDDPSAKRPFQTLLGHRLVMNEDGKPMHKSDGTAIWFEEAAEQLGVDTLRWMYLAQNPAADLRFGTRHPDQPVCLETVDGPITHTKEGLPCAKVTSKPADEVRRMVLLPLWNSYAFFVNYARLDGFEPSLPPVPVSERPEIDRWILSNLQAFLATANERFQQFDSAEVCRSAAAFIDDLSNWYIRRNRRRFWRSRSQAQGLQPLGFDDTDKLAAYQTLYEVLVTLTKALAPVVPFLCERMYGNLVSGGVVSGGDAPESVHLCAYPQADAALLKPELNRRTALAQRIVRMGHRLREEANQRVRQPLAELKYACASEQDAADVAAFADVIADELNVKRLTRAEHLDELVHYSYKPNLKTLGPKYGKRLGEIRALLAGAAEERAEAGGRRTEARGQRPEDRGQRAETGEAGSNLKSEISDLKSQISDLKSDISDRLAALRRGETVRLTPSGAEPIVLAPEDVLITTEQAADWAVAYEPGIQIALSTVVTPELVQEGMARDFVRHVQQARKDAGLEITDRIRIGYTAGEEVAAAVEAWREYIARETLADAIERGTAPADAKSVLVGDFECRVGIERV